MRACMRACANGEAAAMRAGLAELGEAPVRDAQHVVLVVQQVLQLHVQAHNALFARRAQGGVRVI